MTSLTRSSISLIERCRRPTPARDGELEAWRVATAQASNEKVRLFSRLGRLVLDPDIPDEQLRRRIFEEVASRELFAAAVEETEQLLRPRDGSYLDFGENRYGHLRKFAPLVLRVLDFKSLKTDDPLIDAVEILRELNRKRRRRVPEDAGLEFASAKWRGQLLGSDGRVNRRSFELFRAVVIVGEIVSREVDLSPSTLSSRLAARSIYALSISYPEYRFYPRDERSVALVRLLIPIRQVLTDSFLCCWQASDCVPALRVLLE